ncbi:hypothetical protein GA707_06665 [Nostocoides sp. F2B08]|nr:hypothetical protein GA707_06665 [Tetrasphaera sp. F2B08]
MHVDQPGLFDVPDPVTKVPPDPPKRGRNKEVWSMTATAEVVITDASALRQAAARQYEDGAISTVDADPGTSEPQDEAPDGAPVDDPFDALAWLIWPTEGLEGALEVGALRILSVESEAVPVSSDRGRATWRVTAKLTNVDRLRHVATQAHPDQAAEISSSLAIAWQRAADPFSPLRSIDGIAWMPGPVVVEHIPARAAGNR